MPPDARLKLVTCFIDMRFAPKDADRAVQVLLSVVGHTQAKPGCRACTVGRDATEEGRVHYSEEWDSEQGFERHVRSEEFRRVLLAMDLCCEEPQIVVGNLSGHSGIAYVRKLRENAGESTE